MPQAHSVPAWHYKQLEEGDTVRDPIQGEFFATESIENSADALIREGIQNSLDARRKTSNTPWGREVLKVRVTVSGAQKAILPDDAIQFLNSNWEHLEAKGNGLQVSPDRNQACTFLTFEDFGTTGLNGDPSQWRKVSGSENRFFNFFRAEGHSDKSDSDRGRWGVGKTVFPRASRISSFWALTKRESDGAKLLMGRTILKSHDLEDGSTHVPDGYFGVREGDSHIVMPVTDEVTLKQFSDTFGLQRNNEPGVSIVVPFYDEEEITVETIVHAVIVGYFFPILSGELIVEIIGPDNELMTLDQSNLAEIANEFHHSRSLMPVIQLSAWSKTIGDSERFTLNRPPENRAPRWNPDLFPEDVVESLRKKFKAGEQLAVRVPMPVRKKKQDSEWSFFEVYFSNDGSDKRGRPIFVRDGITISDVRGRTTHGIASLVLVVDGPLATMLGDSENPAHTQWQKDCSHYRHKYETGVANIEFVANSVAEIIRLISESDVEEDPTVLIDLFSLPVPSKEDSVKSRKKKQKKQDDPESTGEDDPEPPPPKPKGFRVAKSKGGFSVTSGDPEASQPDQLLIEVAYDDRTRNPLKSWYRTDFDLKKLKIDIPPEHKGSTEVVSASGNQLLIKVLNPSFKINVLGFDERRNLFVRALEKESTDDN
ncbi:MAG: hypothetical protein CME31_22440 [Gimesia sp.]|uniref:Uncharacterized protein n=1 Tax=Gimesia maris TaxID=122 RepID=A0A3D3RE25_9PLAN|nr:hypothetical protein [Gimesia sp.]HCO27063.1 hypothetical protein [Gimesia maris]|tara:strand:- start:16562 stop:18520 length:1959 start_codon:yes stop_codon:yes gene_type:complete